MATGLSRGSTLNMDRLNFKSTGYTIVHCVVQKDVDVGDGSGTGPLRHTTGKKFTSTLYDIEICSRVIGIIPYDGIGSGANILATLDEGLKLQFGDNFSLGKHS